MWCMGERRKAQQTQAVFLITASLQNGQKKFVSHDHPKASLMNMLHLRDGESGGCFSGKVEEVFREAQ